ncbi:hypothetical protein Pa4123_41800 [Phytohabitans aurantiacus]|uniref:Uncharacterized protein n=1 Tax=Phytohabitans aurantiacus TaxID=3016789 RepID=A0ABQ5QWH7_9ACTN|nr:hypothetical protein Pa4123_41800 [Phytohabitans aurantiacus]
MVGTPPSSDPHAVIGPNNKSATAAAVARTHVPACVTTDFASLRSAADHLSPPGRGPPNLDTLALRT